MINRWSNREQIGSSDIFETLHFGLTVELIATPRQDLMTCETGEVIADVMPRNKEPYDFLPVIESHGDGMERIIGLFHAVPYFDRQLEHSLIGDHFGRLEPHGRCFVTPAEPTLGTRQGSIAGLAPLNVVTD